MILVRLSGRNAVTKEFQIDVSLRTYMSQMTEQAVVHVALPHILSLPHLRRRQHNTGTPLCICNHGSTCSDCIHTCQMKRKKDCFTREQHSFISFLSEAVTQEHKVFLSITSSFYPHRFEVSELLSTLTTITTPLRRVQLRAC